MAQSVLACLTVSVLSPVIARSQSVEWRHDYSAAKREAKETNRPLLLDFGTAHCVWCEKLDSVTFRDQLVTKLLSDRFIPVKVAADRDVQLAEALKIQSFPTLVFARPDGKILGMHEGFVDAEHLKGQLQRALSESVVEATPSPPSSPGTPVGNKVLTRISLPPPPEETLQEENARLKREIEQVRSELEEVRGTNPRRPVGGG
jgi:thiol-disulfide isomerase/thioredoxin